MAANLLKKMPDDTQVCVYDISSDLMERFVKEGDGRVQACGSSKEVADKCVGHSHPTLPSCGNGLF